MNLWGRSIHVENPKVNQAGTFGALGTLAGTMMITEKVGATYLDSGGSKSSIGLDIKLGLLTTPFS